MTTLCRGVLGNRWAILFAIIVPLNFLLGVDRNALTVCAPLVRRDLHVDAVVMTSLITAATGIYALLQIPAGWLVHRIGVRLAIFGACFLWSVATLLTAFPQTVGGFYTMRILLGIGQAPDWVACILALKLLFPERDREAANSVLLGSLYIGYSASGWLTSWLMDSLGWRGSFQVYGWVGVMLSLATLLAYGGPSFENASAAPLDRRAPTPRPDGAWRHLLRVVPLAIFYGAVCCLQSFFHVTLTHFVIVRFGLTPGEAGRVFSIPWVVLYIAATGWGAAIRALKKRPQAFGRRQVALAGSSAILIAAICLVGGLLAPNVDLSLIALSGCMLAIGLCQVLTWTSVQNAEWGAAIAAGTVALSGNLTSSAAPVGYELVFRTFGSWSSVCWIVGAIGLIGAVVWQVAQMTSKAERR